MSARSNGSVRRLNSFGTRKVTKGSAHSCSVPCARCSMKHDFPVVESQSQQVAVVREVDEPLAWALVNFACQVRQQVVPVDVHSERLVASCVASLQLLDNVRVTRCGEERGQPVMMLDDLVRDHACRNPPWPSDHLGYTERTFPVCVLLAAERCHTSIGPCVHVRP